MTPQPAPMPTAHLVSLLERWRNGDRPAGNELFDNVQRRLQHFAHQMLRLQPAVHARAETADLLQQSCVRLIQALKQVTPTSRQHFRNLAYLNVRRELKTLARRIQGRAPQPLPKDAALYAPGTTEDELKDLEKWTEFYEAVEQLSEKDVELFELRYFEAKEWEEIAEELGVHERTARKRWACILIALRKAVGNWTPPTDDLPA